MSTYKFDNGELGLCAEVHANGKDCRVVLVDTDANEVVPTVRIYRATELDLAIEYAKRLVA